MMKRKIAVLLTVGLALGMFAVPSFAEDESELMIDLSDVEILGDEADGMEIDLDELLSFEDTDEDWEDAEDEDYVEDDDEEDYIDALEEGEEMYWYIVQYHEDGHDTILLNDVVIALPESWTDQYDMIVKDDRVTFYHKASRAAYILDDLDGGRLFSLCASVDEDYQSLPDYMDLTVGSDGVHYYLEFPTDMQGYGDKEEILAAYQAMYDEIDYVKEEAFGLYDLMMEDFEDATEDEE